MKQIPEFISVLADNVSKPLAAVGFGVSAAALLLAVGLVIFLFRQKMSRPGCSRCKSEYTYNINAVLQRDRRHRLRGVARSKHGRHKHAYRT